MPEHQRTNDDATALGLQEGGAEPSALAPKRCEDLWFDDGSIVLQAGNTQFKVHRGVLSRHSPVFADLFRIPHPPNEPTVEGCSVVELHDSSTDVEDFFLALYGDQEFMNTDGVLGICAVAAMIRLGRKYDIPHLKEEGLRRLKRQFPSIMEEHGKLDISTYEHLGSEPHLVGHQFPFAVINVAHECGIQTILPTLYLETAGYDLENMLFHSDELCIPYAALRRCIYGREKLLHAWIGRSNDTLPCEKCTAKAQCKAASRPLSKALRMAPPDLAATLWPWAGLIRSWKAVRELLQGLCEHCRTELEKAHEKERATLWAVLPSYFKLPGWEDLKDFEA